MLSPREPRVHYETQCPITMITVKNQIFFLNQFNYKGGKEVHVL